MIRVIVADDQRLMCEGLRMILETEPDMQVVAEAADGAEAVALVAVHSPDLVLMDIRMPKLDGVEATRRIRALRNPPRVLILTTFDDDESLFAALKAGAAGYLLKDLPAEELIAAVRTVHAGGALLPPAITARVLTEFARLAASPAQPGPAASAGAAAAGATAYAGRPASPDDPAAAAEQAPQQGDLTLREVEILRLVARGLANKEIAATLYLAEGTVKNYVSHIFAKLGVRDRTQAALAAMRLGLTGTAAGEP